MDVLFVSHLVWDWCVVKSEPWWCGSPFYQSTPAGSLPRDLRTRWISCKYPETATMNIEYLADQDIFRKSICSCEYFQVIFCWCEQFQDAHDNDNGPEDEEPCGQLKSRGDDDGHCHWSRWWWSWWRWCWWWWCSWQSCLTLRATGRRALPLEKAITVKVPL